MKINDAINELKSKGLPEKELCRLEEIADQIQSNMISLKISGLNSDNSLVKMSRLLRILAENLNIDFDHVDTIEKAEYREFDAPSIKGKQHTKQGSQDYEQEANSSATVSDKEKYYEAE